MCGRYTLTTPAEAVGTLFQLESRPNLAPRFNIAPMQNVYGVRNAPNGTRQDTFFRWGLVPAWAKDPAIGNRMINARAETVREKPSYRRAFIKRRCLIAADGFFEWQKPKPGQKGKQPYWITLADKSPFAFAGLWEVWRSPEGESPEGENIESCTIITCPANEFVAPIHARMPVILPGDAHAQWLEADPNQAAELLTPYPAAAMTARAVSTHVNSPGNDDQNCIANLLI